MTAQQGFANLTAETDFGDEMATRALGLPAATGTLPTVGTVWRDGALMLLMAFALRCWWFGDPVVQVDEQFYLLVGDRMLHGAIPYVDIWDRKPIGLFLIYAAIRLLGGTGIAQYQVVATLFAAATALIVVRLARRIAGQMAARLSGCAMLLWMITFDGAGGQSPVFYNLLVAGAALLAVRAVETDERDRSGFLRLVACAMALLGLAIQVKYTALFEGAAMGLGLLWIAYRRGERDLAGAASCWIALAIAPTAIVFAAYALAGHAGIFAYANFQSIGDRPPTGFFRLLKRLAAIVGLASPLIAAAGYGALARWPIDPGRREVRRFLLVWLVSALVGFVAIGTLYKHYFLPALVPLSIMAAPALDGMRRDRWRIALMFGLGIVIAAHQALHRAVLRGGPEQTAQITAAIRPHLTDRLFVFEGEPILYYTTGAALASRYAFPSHLNSEKEAPAIGVDQAREVARVMASLPSVVVINSRAGADRNPSTWQIVTRALARNYLQVASVRVHGRWRLIYARRQQAV